MFQGFHQRVIAITAQTLLLQGAVKLEDGAGSQGRHAELVGGFQDEAQVFLLEVDGEARFANPARPSVALDCSMTNNLLRPRKRPLSQYLQLTGYWRKL